MTPFGAFLELRIEFGPSLIPCTRSDVSLRVVRGEWVALVGPSGGGKSTILALAAGLLAPDCGAVAFDGGRLTRPGLAASGARIGYLLQRTELFRSSIADNLLMGRSDASDDELRVP